MTADSTKIIDLLNKCRLELFSESADLGDNKKKLIRLLQELSLQNFDKLDVNLETEKLVKAIWEHPVLLEDCILVSGIIFAKLNFGLEYSKLCEMASIEKFKNKDWIGMSLLRGIIQDQRSDLSQDKLEHFANLTISAINEAFTGNRVVLICRHLENLLHIFSVEQALGCYNVNSRGQEIVQIVNRTLRLDADLTDYKSRDLIKWHLNILSSQGFSSDSCSSFTSSILDCLPEMSKISIQIYDALCSINHQNHSIHTRIFKLTLPCLSVKGGLGSAAAQCITKLLSMENVSNSSLLNEMLHEIFEYPSSKDVVKVLKLILTSSSAQLKTNILAKINEFPPSPINQLLTMIVNEESDASVLARLLDSGDEFIALEAFSILTKDSVKQRRKPTTEISSSELCLFQSFVENVLFSGSVDFRQKVSVSAKSFYEQIFARIYHLIRELCKKPREVPLVDGQVDSPVVADRERIRVEMDGLFAWLEQFVKSSLVEPIDFCHSNFGSVDFAFTQILGIFAAFDGNVTLVAANPVIIESISEKFKSSVIDSALLPFTDNFIHCVGKSTYDIIRMQAIEILCRCNVDASKVSLEEYSSGLIHPRAINNEGAARIVHLHSRLAKESRLSSILDELRTSFDQLKLDFPASLRANNINGRLLLLRFLLQERPEVDSKTIEDIINLAVEVSSFVSTIASHPSPEGLNVAQSEDADENENDFEPELDDSNVASDGSISSQYVLSFSWRAVKETSALIETLLKTFSTKVSKEQFLFVAEHFKSLLLKLRHCGAFRALQTPLSTTLRLGFSFPEKSKFLMDSLEVCLGVEHIATTRRSAGLPFLVLALAHSCSGRSDELNQLLAYLIPPLLATAKIQDAYSLLSPSVIHAFNIIRSLVRDSRIAPEMGPHMSPIADLCLSSFNSAHWNVRNASAMLLSSLISRIFGPKHVNDLSGRDHQVDLREIEVKFDGLLKVLDAFLKFESLDFEPRIAYPLLAVLERIRIPPHERFDDFRSSVAEFLAKLLENLEAHPECGRKLAHVLGRTVFSLLSSKSIDIETVRNDILGITGRNTPNGIYNSLVLIENIQFFDSSFDFASFLPPCSHEWHQILQLKYQQVASHKCPVEPKFLLQNESPVLSSDLAVHELTKRLPNIKLICKILANGSLHLDLVFKIIETFNLNEEILKLAIPMLCKAACEPIDERLRGVLTFYASAENNENLRIIALDGLSNLKSDLLKNIPRCVFSLLLDDDEDIRNEICTILNPSNPMNLAQTLKGFVALAGAHEFIQFLDEYEAIHAPQKISKISLFEKEPLNLFIDVQLLRKKFTPKYMRYF